jgi:C4-dicarboxylate transporter DctM subunit
MESETIGLLGLLLLVLFVMLGVPIAAAAGLVGFLGICYLAGWTAAFSSFGGATFVVTGNFTFSTIPLYIIMGYFAFNAGLAEEAFEAGRRWLRHIAGGLSMATVVACAAFGACSGASSASAAVFSKMAIPAMLKMNYHPRLAAGVVAASGTLAAIIPPSGIMIVYAVLVEVPIGKQLIAGLIPGLLTAAVYGLSLYIRVRRNPAIAGGIQDPAPWKERLSALPRMWGVIVIAVVIVGGITTGVMTPTESAAIGAVVALIMLLSNRRIPKWRSFTNAVRETGVTTAMVILIFVGVTVFSSFLALSRLPNAIIEGIAELAVNRWLIVIGIMVLFLILGCFLNAIAIVSICIPIIAPIVKALGFDLIWFGVLTVKVCEIGCITPPVGLTAYVVNSVAKIPLGEVFRGSLPFIWMDLVVLALLILIPQISLYLPSLAG